MIPYNILQEVDMDSHRYGSYYSNVYEFPFPEMPILKERDKEMNRLLRKPIITMRSDSNNCQKGE
jgi:hypothetical protein|tara:strand:+ start:572 stop:766 length:195 start_codon:yes stop_codon:yes gene_type:complete